MVVVVCDYLIKLIKFKDPITFLFFCSQIIYLLLYFLKSNKNSQKIYKNVTYSACSIFLRYDFFLTCAVTSSIVSISLGILSQLNANKCVFVVLNLFEVKTKKIVKILFFYFWQKMTNLKFLFV